MLAFLAINSTYRGPYTPGSATCLAFALAWLAAHHAYVLEVGEARIAIDTWRECADAALAAVLLFLAEGRSGLRGSCSAALGVLCAFVASRLVP